MSAWLPTIEVSVATARIPLYGPEPNALPAVHQKTFEMTPLGPDDPPWTPMNPSDAQPGAAAGKAR